MHDIKNIIEETRSIPKDISVFPLPNGDKRGKKNWQSSKKRWFETLQIFSTNDHLPDVYSFESLAFGGTNTILVEANQTTMFLRE